MLAIIPARGASKRIEDKNMQTIGNRVLIKWVVDAIRNSSSITRIFVSSDYHNILNYCDSIGLQVDIRPKELAQDTTTMQDVTDYILKKYDYNEACIIQPTSPFVESKDIDGAVALFNETHRTVASVSAIDGHPEWYYSLNDEAHLQPLIGADYVRKIRSQDLPQYYTLNGMIRIVTKHKFEPEVGYIISDKERCIDIDTPEDLERAREYFEQKGKQWITV